MATFTRNQGQGRLKTGWSKETQNSPLYRAASSPSANSLAASNLIVIGASLGGFKALPQVTQDFPTDLPAAVVIVVHGSPGSPYAVGYWNERLGHLPVQLASDGDRLKDGHVYLAPADKRVRARGTFLEVSERPDENGVSDIDELFHSAARAYGSHAIGVVLSGLLRDGAAGLRAIAAAGGLTMVQNPADAECGDMPANAMKEGPVDFCLPLPMIGQTLDLLVRRNGGFECGIKVCVRAMEERMALYGRIMNESGNNSDTLNFLLSEIHALRKEVEDLKALHRRN